MLKGLVVALLLIAAPVSAQPANESVKTELQAFIKELNAALQARDRAALERLYAPEFIFVHTIGPPISREEHLATTMKTAPRNSVPIPSLDGLIVIGNVAMLRTRQDERFSTSIWAKRNGQWQVVQIQASVLPPSRPAVSVPIEVLQSYAGRYQQNNGLFVTIGLEGDRLTLQVDGRTKLNLTAVSQTEFTLPGNTGRITFAANGTYEVVRPNQANVTGKKQ